MAPYTLAHTLLCVALPSILLVDALPSNIGTTIVSHDFHRGDDGASEIANLNAVASASRPMTQLRERHLGDDELFERADKESSSLHCDIQAGLLHKRTLINQADFEGRQLAKLLDTDNPFPNAHQWTDLDALDNWEWRQNNEKCGLEHEDDIIDPVSASLGLKVRVIIRKERWENPSSQAEYKTFMEPGVIFSWDESAPQGKYPPQLSRLSDVVPMIYKDAFPTNSLRLVVEMIVDGPDTASVIDALRSNKQLPNPPVTYSNREVFEIGTPQFHALLGTPTRQKLTEGGGGNSIIFGQNLCTPEIHFWSQDRLASTLAFRLMDAPCGAAEGERNYLPKGIAVGAGRPSKLKSDTKAAQGGIVEPEGSANFGGPGSSKGGRRGRQKRSASSHRLARRGNGDFPATDADEEEDPDVSGAEWQDTVARGKRSAAFTSSHSGRSYKIDQDGDLIMTDARDNALIPSAEGSASKADASSDAGSSGFSDDDVSMTDASNVNHNDLASVTQSLDDSADTKNDAAQTIYDNASAKGKEVIQLLDLEPTAAMQRQSRWTQFKDLARYGWIIDDPDPDEIEQDFTWDGMQVLNSELNLGGKTHLAGYVCIHDKAVKVDGVDYPATKAVYKNYFSLDAGGIVVVQANSPQRAGPDSEPPVNGPFPPLSHWSDLTYLILQELTKAQPSKLRGLKTITFAMIDNKLFKEVLEWIMCGTGTDYDEIYWDDRLSFLYGSEEYVTLMGTPIGVAAAHFLGQHKRELGWLGIAKIEIFRDDDPEESDSGPVPHMVMYLEDGPVLQSIKGQILDKELSEEPESIGTSTGRTTRSSSRRDADEIQNASLSDHSLVRREEDKFAALDAATKECNIFALKMQDTGNDNTVSACTTIREMKKSGCEQLKGDHNQVDLDETLRPFLEKLRIHPNEVQDIEWRHLRAVNFDVVDYKATNACSDSYCTKGAIFVNDAISPTVNSRPGTLANPPKLQHWSQGSGIIYLDMFLPARPEAVVHMKITQDRSRLVVDHMVAKYNLKKDKSNRPGLLSFAPKEPAYLALVGIPNGTSIAHLLTEQRDILGDRCVEGIHIWWTSNRPWIWYEIGHAPCGVDVSESLESSVVGAKSEAGSSKSEVKQLEQLPPRPVEPQLTTENAIGSLTEPTKSDYDRQGHQKRADNPDRALLSRCLHYGAALASQLNSRDHSNSQPSQFRAGQLQDATARSGWCLDRATSMTFTATPLAPALQQMGITNGGPLQIREWSFDTDANDENARQAINSGLYHEGLIVAVGSESPSHTVGHDAALPELQYWSDIAFLHYTQHYPRAPLKNIIRQGVIESDTIAVIEMIRHSRRLGDERSDQNYPQAPNVIVLEWGTNHFNAMLGTAGGKGVAHMLLQHRQDLGHRCVEDIRIWYGPDKDLPTVWFKIKQAPCRGPSRRSKRTLSEAPEGDNNIASRSEDENALLDEYSKKGAGWAVGLNGEDPDIWCESIWTVGQLQDATSAWGWTCTADEVSSASSLVSAGPVMEVMYHRTPEEVMVRKVTWKHNRQVTTPEGPLPPTLAEYTNYYVPGAIIGERDESPKQSGRSHGIDVNNDENLPALRDWSDVTFLQYAQLFADQPLQTVVRQEVYNEATKQVVDAIRHHYKLDDDRVLTNYPQFPGLLFNYGTKEFQALLAVPVGEDVVHLLSQHLDALGQLCVWGIRVFWNINMQNPTIWYRIKQAPCGRRDALAAVARRSIDEPPPDR